MVDANLLSRYVELSALEQQLSLQIGSTPRKVLAALEPWAGDSGNLFYCWCARHAAHCCMLLITLRNETNLYQCMCFL